MNIAVTGANGQVGTRLLERLQDCDINVTGLVRRSSGVACGHVVSDWMQADEAAEAISSADAIVHLAGTLAPKDGDYEAANVGPTERIVHVACDTVESDGIDSVECAEVDDLAGPAHARPMQCRARVAFDFEMLPGPVE